MKTVKQIVVQLFFALGLLAFFKALFFVIVFTSTWNNPSQILCLRGKISGIDGNPVPNAAVVVIDSPNSSWFRRCEATTSDPNGNFILNAHVTTGRKCKLFNMIWLPEYNREDEPWEICIYVAKPGYIAQQIDFKTFTMNCTIELRTENETKP